MLKKSKRGGLNSFSQDWTESLSRPSKQLRGSPRFSPEHAMTAPLLFSSGEVHLLWSLFLFWRNSQTSTLRYASRFCERGDASPGTPESFANSSEKSGSLIQISAPVGTQIIDSTSSAIGRSQSKRFTVTR